MYKIVSKILATRLNQVMHKIIADNQGAFIKNRWIAKNSILAHEVIHQVKRSKGKGCLMVLKFDLKKAYDKLEWGFLDNVLATWGFNEGFRKLVVGCVRTVSYPFLINGSTAGNVSPSRGLKQGDPISPLLFILCAEFLTSLFNKEEAAGNMHGIKIDRAAPPLRHLMYADDLLVTSRANEFEAEIIKKCIGKYYKWSGQEVNAEKSSILFSKNTSGAVKRNIKQILRLKEMKPSCSYLGTALILGKNERKEFGRIKEKVLNRVQGRNAQLLSKAGKSTLIKSVIQSIPCYNMSTFLPPKTFCNELDAITRKF